MHILSGYHYVHTPHTRDDIHRQNDCAQNGELAQHISCLLLALVHADVDLCQVVRVGPRKQPAPVSTSKEIGGDSWTYVS